MLAAIDTLKSQSYMLSFDTGHIMVHIETIMFMNSFVDLEINLNVKKKIILIQKSCKNMS